MNAPPQAEQFKSTETVFHSMEMPIDDESDVVYDEDDCDTDNEEEVAHDLVACIKCGAKTHYLNGECGKCGEAFKISKAGYVLTGEDGDFLCDEGEVIETMSDGYETPDIDKVSVPESGDESDMETETDSEEDSEEDNEHMCCDDEVEYETKKDISHVLNAPRRITRSMAK